MGRVRVWAGPQRCVTVYTSAYLLHGPQVTGCTADRTTETNLLYQASFLLAVNNLPITAAADESAAYQDANKNFRVFITNSLVRHNVTRTISQVTSPYVVSQDYCVCCLLTIESRDDIRRYDWLPCACFPGQIRHQHQP